jgi:hypothetical protein
MTQPNASDAANAKEARLPRRDWILLPLIGLLTICAIAVFTELISRRIFSESKTTLNSCLILNDPSTGVRGIPNSVCREKFPESQWVEYKFDGCGYRSGMICGPKIPGAYRIVMTGSSAVLGELVPIDKTFATLLPVELSRITGRKVELYNEGLGLKFARYTDLSFNDVLAAQPDLVLWVVTPLDVRHAAFPDLDTEMSPDIDTQKEKSDRTAPDRPAPVRPSPVLKSAIEWMKAMLGQHAGAIVTGQVLRHFLYEHESQGQYVQAYLLKASGNQPHSVGINGDANFLQSELNPEWKAHLREFDTYAADIESKAKAAGVPLVVVLLPNRAQAAMISMGNWPEGYDPYGLDNKLSSIVVSHGGTYVDVLPYFRTLPNPEQGFFPIDGHLNAEGHAMIVDILARALTGGPVPALKVAAPQQPAREQGK